MPHTAHSILTVPRFGRATGEGLETVPLTARKWGLGRSEAAGRIEGHGLYQHRSNEAGILDAGQCREQIQVEYEIHDEVRLYMGQT